MLQNRLLPPIHIPRLLPAFFHHQYPALLVNHPSLAAI